MEGDLIYINEWLRPIAWLYGLGVRTRNALFDMGLLKSRSFPIPIISVGNITVGGTGKTPHTEYLIRLLRSQYKVAVLSRGYKRKSKGFVLSAPDTPMKMIGDEPFQMKQKYPDIHVAVDRDRCHGIDCLRQDPRSADTEVIILDDAYQHRYVKPGLNILLVDYHRMITEDALLPAGRLREPQQSKARANVVIVTKCPQDIKPMGYRVIRKALQLYPYQKLFFSTLRYSVMHQLFGQHTRSLNDLRQEEQVMLLTGIATPRQMMQDIQKYCRNVSPLPFSDHHDFSHKDVDKINRTFRAMRSPKTIITTEKDATRLLGTPGLEPEVKEALYVLPIEIEILQNQQTLFNETITGYVFKNSRDGILAQGQDDHTSHHGNHIRHRARQAGR